MTRRARLGRFLDRAFGRLLEVLGLLGVPEDYEPLLPASHIETLLDIYAHDPRMATGWLKSWLGADPHLRVLMEDTLIRYRKGRDEPRWGA